MSLSTSHTQLQEHVNAYANEIVALIGGRKSAAPKARKHLQMLKELSARLRSEVLDHTKPKKNDTAAPAAEEMATAAAAILELASPPAENSEPAPKPKRVRRAPKKLN
jgi:hypothetical protein